MHLIGASFFGARRSYLGIAAIFTRPDSGLDSGTTLFLKKNLKKNLPADGGEEA